MDSLESEWLRYPTVVIVVQYGNLCAFVQSALLYRNEEAPTNTAIPSFSISRTVSTQVAPNLIIK